MQGRRWGSRCSLVLLANHLSNPAYRTSDFLRHKPQIVVMLHSGMSGIWQSREQVSRGGPHRASNLPFWWRVTPRYWLLVFWKPLLCRRSVCTTSSFVTCAPATAPSRALPLPGPQHPCCWTCLHYDCTLWLSLAVSFAVGACK